MYNYTKITPSYILSHNKTIIKKYKKTWNTDVIIKVVPKDVNVNNLSTILNTMLCTGYTFIASYYKNKSDCEFMGIEDITILDWFTQPRNTKVQVRKNELLLDGYIKPVTLNSKHQLVDGYSTYIMLKQCGEKYIPYIIDDNYIDTKHRHSNIDDKTYLYMKQDGKCYICGRHTYMDAEYRHDSSYATIDHVVPLSKGGKNDISNMAISCSVCNGLKGQFRFSEELRKVIVMELEERGLL